MQPLDRRNARESERPERIETRPTAEIISLDEWRRQHRRKAFAWGRSAKVPSSQPVPAWDSVGRRRRVPVEVWLMALIVVSAIAGAMFALMGLGYLP
jgi:hypothetical protein